MKRIFVANLPYQTSTASLSAWFQRNGFAAKSVDLATDCLSGHSRGFGFVEMPDQMADQCVSACNGMDFLGRTLVVNDASTLLHRRPGANAKRL